MAEYLFKFMGGRKFYGRTPSGHDTWTDTSVDNGGDNSAPTPVEMVFAGLAGCTGIDVAMVLEKKRVKFDDLQIRITGERVDGYPKIFKSIKIIYEFTGKELPFEKIKRAVELSQDKYCTVSGMLKGSAEMTYEIVLKEPEASPSEDEIIDE